MTRIQWLALNAVSGILIILLLIHLSLSRSNTKTAAQLNTARAYVNNARQVQPALENLVRRRFGELLDHELFTMLLRLFVRVVQAGSSLRPQSFYLILRNEVLTHEPLDVLRGDAR